MNKLGIISITRKCKKYRGSQELRRFSVSLVYVSIFFTVLVFLLL
jgi:hypothetical protein